MKTARIVITNDVTGDIRLRLCPEKPIADREVSRPRKAALVCSDKLQDMTSKKNEPCRGHGKPTLPRQFTKLARKRLREAGQICKEKYGKNAIFATGTLPGTTPEALSGIADYSGYIMGRVKQRIRDKIEESSMFGVWEWQLRGALHIHVCVASNDREALTRFGEEWHIFWCQLLEQVSVMAGVDLFGLATGSTRRFDFGSCVAEADWVRSDVARYVSKYASKIKSKLAAGAYRYPVSWWSVSNDLRKIAEERRTKECSDVLPFNEAVSLFEVVGGKLSESAASVYVIRNEFKCDEKHLVALFPAETAPSMYDARASEIRNGKPRWKGNAKTLLPDVRQYFEPESEMQWSAMCALFASSGDFG